MRRRKVAIDSGRRERLSTASSVAFALCSALAVGCSVPALAEEGGEAAGDSLVDVLTVSAQHAISAPSSAAEPASDPVTVELQWSQFVDATVSGDAPGTVRYGGKVDLGFLIDDAAIGMDDGWSMHLHPEFRYGETSNGEVGLIPGNTSLFWPENDGEIFDLSINVTKRWQSGTSLTVGKVNVLDLSSKLPVVGGGGHVGFENLAFALPPSAIVPASITGALLDIPTEDVLFRVWVFDPAVQHRRSGFEDPFERGVAFLASATFPVKIGGKSGYYAIKLAGSTRDDIADDALPAVLIPPPGSGFGDESESGEFSVVLAGYQNIVEHAAHPGKGIGLFGQVYWSNGDPTFLDRSAIFGISGNPAARPQDHFGIGWFRYSITNELVRVLAPRLALEDEEGVEIFYTAGLTEWLRLTADLQIVDSAISARSTGVTAGLRLTTTF